MHFVEFNPFPPNDVIWRHETQLYDATSGNVLDSAPAERAEQGEVGGFTRRVQTASPHLGSALNSPWLEPGRPFLGF